MSDESNSDHLVARRRFLRTAGGLFVGAAAPLEARDLDYAYRRLLWQRVPGATAWRHFEEQLAIVFSDLAADEFLSLAAPVRQCFVQAAHEGPAACTWKPVRPTLKPTNPMSCEKMSWQRWEESDGTSRRIAAGARRSRSVLRFRSMTGRRPLSWSAPSLSPSEWTIRVTWFRKRSTRGAVSCGSRH